MTGAEAGLDPYAASPFDLFYGLELIPIDGGVDGRLRIAPHHRQPTGIVHGGVYAAIGEAIASHTANVGLAASRQVAFGMTNVTSFLRPVADGTLHATATPRHRGRETWLVDVHISDDDARPCAISRVTLAVRPQP